MRVFLGALLLAASLVVPASAQERAFPIFFTPWSALLDDAAEAGLNEVAALARQHPQVPIVVIGYADPQGSREANVLVSRLRAVLVAEELRERGVAAGRIRTEYRGPTNPAFENLESRRVEIRVDRR
jgi:outer membrane protein OmpA-like peptidoglycan-associated protein